MALTERLRDIYTRIAHGAHAGPQRGSPALPSRAFPGPVTRQAHAVTKYLMAHPIWQNEDMFLVDVGASGGIDLAWNLYGPRLRAVGFDPLVTEVERLNRLNENPRVKYVDGFVDFAGYQALCDQDPYRHLKRDFQYFPRSSAQLGADLVNMNIIKETFNSGAEVVMSPHHIELDKFFQGDDFSKVDFIKIDTDSHEMEVLLGAEKLLTSGRVLGLKVEIQFHGPVNPYSSVFCNIDRFLRERGFVLYDLEFYRYTKGAMPGEFLYNMLAQTHTGQVMFGDAVYMRDLANPRYEAMWGWKPTVANLVKTISLYEFYQLYDCAAELLLNHREELGDEVVETCLDLLTPSGQPGSYLEHMTGFATDVQRRFGKR